MRIILTSFLAFFAGSAAMYAMVDPPRFAGVAQSAILFEGRKTFCFGDGSDRFLGEAAMVSRLAVRSGLAPTLVIESFKCRVGKL